MRRRLHTPTRTYALHYNNKQLVCFFDDACYNYFLVRLCNSLRQFHIQLHAYCLVSKDIYLLLTPATPEGINHLWQSVSTQYNNYFRERFARSIRIIQPAFQSKPLVDDNEVLQAQLYIESASRMIPGIHHPGVHPWSSYCNNGFGDKSPWLKPHRAYLHFLAANSNGSSAYNRYRNLVASKRPAVIESFPAAATTAALINSPPVR